MVYCGVVANLFLPLLLLASWTLTPLVSALASPQQPQMAAAAAARNTAIALMVAAATTCAPSSALAGGDVGRGEQLFTGNCASCHANGQNVVSPERTLRADALQKYGIGLDQPSIYNFVTNSQRHKNLVFFKVEGGKLNPDQWQDVTTYIADQASGDKWE